VAFPTLIIAFLFYWRTRRISPVISRALLSIRLVRCWYYSVSARFSKNVLAAGYLVIGLSEAGKDSNLHIYASTYQIRILFENHYTVKFNADCRTLNHLQVANIKDAIKKTK
jgi:hypothetical protein